MFNVAYFSAGGPGLLIQRHGIVDSISNIYLFIYLFINIY